MVFKLSDFGRATRVGEDRDGEDLGDGRYLPRLDDSSSFEVVTCGRDIYALGTTLYHSVSSICATLIKFPQFGVIGKNLPNDFRRGVA